MGSHSCASCNLPRHDSALGLQDCQARFGITKESKLELQPINHCSNVHNCMEASMHGVHPRRQTRIHLADLHHGNKSAKSAACGVGCHQLRVANTYDCLPVPNCAKRVLFFSKKCLNRFCWCPTSIGKSLVDEMVVSSARGNESRSFFHRLSFS